MVLTRDGWECQLCGKDLRKPGSHPQVDHILPVKRLLDLGERVDPSAIDPGELRALCRDCNLARNGKLGGNRQRSAASMPTRPTSVPSPWEGIEE